MPGLLSGGSWVDAVLPKRLLLLSFSDSWLHPGRDAYDAANPHQAALNQHGENCARYMDRDHALITAGRESGLAPRSGDAPPTNGRIRLCVVYSGLI